MKRRIAVGGAMQCVALAVLLSACGGEDKPGGQAGGTPTPTPSGIQYQTVAPSPDTSRSYAIGGFVGIGYDGDPSTGEIVPNSPVSGENPGVAFKYEGATQRYTLVTIDPFTQEETYILFSTPASTIDQASSNALFDGYKGTTFGTNATAKFHLYRFGNSNPELKLPYSGFAHLARQGPIQYLNFGDFWFGFGVETLPSDIPKSGSATYSGVLHGFAVDAEVGEQYTVEGKSMFVLDFTN